MFHTPRILLLTNDAEERNKLAELLQSYAVLACAGNLRDMATALKESDWDMLLCDRPFYLKGWNLILDRVEEFCPALPVIVLSRSGEDREWIEALESGAFDLLGWPTPKPTILAAVEQAMDSLEARKIHGRAAEPTSAQYAS